MSMYPWRAGEVITAEKLVSGMQYGLVNIAGDTEVSPTGSSAHFAGSYWRGEANIVFDIPFLDIPTIQVTARTGFPAIFIEASYTNVTPTGMTVVVARGNTTATNVDWLAIGRPAL